MSSSLLPIWRRSRRSWLRTLCVATDTWATRPRSPATCGVDTRGASAAMHVDSNFEYWLGIPLRLCRVRKAPTMLDYGRLNLVCDYTCWKFYRRGSSTFAIMMQSQDGAIQPMRTTKSGIASRTKQHRARICILTSRHRQATVPTPANSLLSSTTIATRTHSHSSQMNPDTTPSVPPAVDISSLLARRWNAERYEIRALYKRIEDSWTNVRPIYCLPL